MNVACASTAVVVGYFIIWEKKYLFAAAAYQKGESERSEQSIQ